MKCARISSLCKPLQALLATIGSSNEACRAVYLELGRLPRSQGHLIVPISPQCRSSAESVIVCTVIRCIY
eukprot:366436-Chlamydomonas_euryale.AAC.17